MNRRVLAAPLLTRPMTALLATVFGAFSGFYLLLPVVPAYLAGAGGGEAGAGLATGAMMLSTVLVEPAAPRLTARLGYRAVLGLGLALLGVPTLALLGSAELWLVLGVCLLRGVGLGILVVAGSALVAELAPPSRRAEGLALYGTASNLPGVVGAPAGVWFSEHVGFAPVFTAGVVLTLLPLAAVAALPSRSGPAATDSVLGALRIGGLVRPALVFTAVTFAAGVFATFLPLAVPAVAAGALLVQSLAMLVARYAAGRLADRHGAGPLLVPATLAAVAGTTLTWAGSPLLGMALFGAGFGAAQNVTLALMMERVDSGAYGRTSALWNLAYDTGFGVGAVGFGLVAGPLGFTTGFALTATVLATALIPTALDRKERP